MSDFKPDDEALRLHTFELVVYVNEAGEQRINWRWTGEDVTLMHALGYLESAKLGLYHGQLEEYGKDEDDV